MAVDTPYSICTRALVQIGANTVTSFDDQTTESIVAGEVYDPTVKEVLTAFPWRFNAKMGSLTRLGEEPLDRWTYYFQAPSDALDIRAVLSGGTPIPFDRYGNKIACDYASGLVCEYGYRAGEVYFPAYFTAALVGTLKAKFTLGIRRDFNAAEGFEKQAEKLWARARHRDSVQQTTRKMPRSSLVTIRG